MAKEKSQQQDEFGISRELKLRIISAAILIPLVVAIIYFGGLIFSTILIIAAVIMSFEWNNIITSSDKLDDKEKIRWEIYGIILIIAPIISLLWIRNVDESYGVKGFVILAWLFSLIWATDIAAYFAGKRIGGPKLASKISPKKTWAGLIAGILAAAFVGFVMAIIINTPNKLVLTLISALLGIVEQISDLLESAVKRHFKVKDSGSIIPGHGGLLDRVDGFILTCPFVAILLLVTDGDGLFR